MPFSRCPQYVAFVWEPVSINVNTSSSKLKVFSIESRDLMPSSVDFINFATTISLSKSNLNMYAPIIISAFGLRSVEMRASVLSSTVANVTDFLNEEKP